MAYTAGRTTSNLGDKVMVERPGATPWYGVVRWIGELPGSQPEKAFLGVEMEEEVPGGGNGIYSDNKKLFSCKDGHGLFLPIDEVYKDDRFEGSDESPAPSEEDENQDKGNPAAPADVAPLEVLEEYLFNQACELSLSTAAGTNHEQSSNELSFVVPGEHVELLIGQEGENIQAMERLTNTSIVMGSEERGVIHGTKENIKRVLQMILDKLEENAKRDTVRVETIKIPESKIGLLLGKGGDTIRAVKTLSGVIDIKVTDQPQELSSRNCEITGSGEDIEKAKRLITLSLNGNIMRATLAALISSLSKFGVAVVQL